jgi:hypothetical protein
MFYIACIETSVSGLDTGIAENHRNPLLDQRLGWLSRAMFYIACIETSVSGLDTGIAKITAIPYSTNV